MNLTQSELKDAKVLVVRQPWAWLIVHSKKDIENRTWKTGFRGPLLIQASATLPSRPALEWALNYARERGVRLPESFETGGIVGVARLVDCVPEGESRWFEGPVGWVLRNRRALLLVPLKGRLGLFKPPKSVISRLLRRCSG